MMMFKTILAHFHPVLVHLPIGILLLAILFHGLSSKEKYSGLFIAVPIAYKVGALTAMLSCITGYLLSGSGEYDETTLSLHQWMGILVAFTAIAGYLYAKNKNASQLKWISIVLFFLITITGHLGGTLTHGEGYLWKQDNTKKNGSATIVKPISNAQEAQVYNDIIQPIFEQKCYNCHAATKQKGGLRLDAESWIIKGGKNGAVLVAGHADSSALYKRIVLNPLEEKHMPPKGKPQLTEQEQVLLAWWIQTGADFNKKSKELTQTVQIKNTLKQLEQTETKITLRNDFPEIKAPVADTKSVEVLRKNSVTVHEIAENNNWMSANFVNCKIWDLAIEKSIEALKDQIVWIYIPGAKLEISSWNTIAGLNHLTRLDAANSNITDRELIQLSSLPQLHYLNLVGTKITATGLLQMKTNANLTEIFLGQIGISSDNYLKLKVHFPHAVIDTGGYKVPLLATDTQQLHPKQ